MSEGGGPADKDIIPVSVKSRKSDGDFTQVWMEATPLMGSTCEQRQEVRMETASGQVVVDEDSVTMETCESSGDELGRLDIDLDRKSIQHNLTSSNVRAILHEVITHEHVVAMMKVAIRDTQDLPMFEPKMTRSRVKQAVQEGLVNLSSIQPAQFVDIDLEDDEDSSDEEYCPDGEDEDDTAEETFFSDGESLSSPPRMHLASQVNPADLSTERPLQNVPEHLRKQVKTSSVAPQHLLTASPDCSFLERLNAVDEELDCSPTYTYDQSLDRKTSESGGSKGSSCLAYRTRSRLPLVNVPLDQLEAELLAPDITADMYDQGRTHREEDRHWTNWLHSLMAPDCEDEVDDDDPEYNFLEDLDEPDLEDYRTDRGVQITKKEVNELLEELFDTLQDEDVAAEDEDQEEEEVPSLPAPKFNVPQALRFQAPLASMLTERRQTVRRQYEALQQKRALQDTNSHLHSSSSLRDMSHSQLNATDSMLLLPNHTCPSLHLDHAQKLQLQQQLQQHVQLLTQVHLLSRRVQMLNHEASITKQYLEELLQFACRQEEGQVPSSFRVCNLQEALDLLQEVEPPDVLPAVPPAAASRRLLPQMTPATSSHAFPLLPADTAWLLATRPIFMYPQLLPVCSLDPALHSRHHRSVFTSGEDGLIVLGLKHFEGTVQPDQLISSYLLCKSRWNVRKHIKEMSSARAPSDNIIKMFLTQGVAPPLPLACCRVQPEDQCPPVDRDILNMPNWLKNSQLIIQKTRLDASGYPPSLPPGCTLRLHPHYVRKSCPSRRVHRRLFTLAHNGSLLPLAKAPIDTQVDRQVAPPSPSVILLSNPTPVSGGTEVAPSPDVGTIQWASFRSVSAPPSHADIIGATPLPYLSSPIIPHSATEQPACLMAWTLPANTSQHALGKQLLRPITEKHPQKYLTKPCPISTDEMKVEEDCYSPASTLSPLSFCGGGEDEERTVMGGGSEHPERTGEGGGHGQDGEGEQAGDDEDRDWEDGDGEEEDGGGDEADGGGERENGGDEEEDGGREEEDGGGDEEDAGGDGEEDGEKDKEDQERQGEEEDEEEEEDFDDLTQDEDEEEVMSSASEESVLSVPELQETMKKLTWLAAERRLCPDGDSEEDHSPISPGSQEEEEEEEEGPKEEEESGEGRGSKAGLDEEMPSGEGMPRGAGGRCPGRGRGRSRPHRGLRRSRQERHSKDAAKLLLLYDENILDHDPHRETKDLAFAQTYLSRVREALHDTPEQVEEFVSLLNKFEQVGEQEVMSLFRKLRCILGNRTDLLRDFAAFLHPDQALQCGLFEEQQAFDRSRRFLRQLEISFGDNPSHYQKIIKALQTGPDLSPASIQELKSQMATLLKGHIHLQAEFWVFFDELRPPPARPGQFEEAHWPEEEGAEGVAHVAGGGASAGFEEVTLPELEEEEEGQKSQPMTSRRQRRKMDPHRNDKDCDWSEKDWRCLCGDAKIRRHRRKGCSRCHSNQTSLQVGVSRVMKSLDPLYAQITTTQRDVKGSDDGPQLDQGTALWESSFSLAHGKEEEEEEELDDEDVEEEENRKNREKEKSPIVKRRKTETSHCPFVSSSSPPSSSPPSSAPPFVSSSSPPSSAPPFVSSSSPPSSAPPFVSSSSPPSSSPPSSAPPFVSSSSPPSSAPPFVSSSSPPSSSPPSSAPPFVSSSSPPSSAPPFVSSSSPPSSAPPSVSFSSSSAPSRPIAPPDLPVCAKNISLTASGEKVILWTREADRVILTKCQQDGANQNTFQAISSLLGNKTPAEVSRRFRDLMRLFRTAARQTSSEDEALPTETGD